MRNFSIEELSITSNGYAVVSKGGGVVMLFIREADEKNIAQRRKQKTDCSNEVLWIRNARKTWLHWDLVCSD